jgi:hypothetical protein
LKLKNRPWWKLKKVIDLNLIVIYINDAFDVLFKNGNISNKKNEPSSYCDVSLLHTATTIKARKILIFHTQPSLKGTRERENEKSKLKSI